MSSLIVKKEFQGEPVPTGMQQAVCAMICDIGTHHGEYQGVKNQKHQCVIIWELNETKKLGKFEGERFQIGKFYTLSLDDKATLRKDLASWRGRDFTSEELEGFDLAKLIGVNCFLNITSNDGKAKISAITPLAKGMQTMTTTLKVEPEWVAKKRAESIEARGGGNTQGAPNSQQEDDLPF